MALAAAVLHAGWNLVLARTRDPTAVGSLAFVVAVVLFAPVAVARWDVHAAAIPYVLASNALEIAYLLLLTAAYTRAELSLVYPLARGLAPVLVLAISVAALGDSPGAVAAVGVLAVASGVALIRGVGASGTARGVAFGVAIAACIAGYTLVDKRGLEHAGTLSYLELVLIGPALVGSAWVAWSRGPAGLRRAFGPPAVAVAIGSLAAFLLALLALRRADAAPVAAVRETSVVFAALLAPAVLGERVSRVRLLGVALVAVGVALLGFG